MALHDSSSSSGFFIKSTPSSPESAEELMPHVPFHIAYSTFQHTFLVPCTDLPQLNYHKEEFLHTITAVNYETESNTAPKSASFQSVVGFVLAFIKTFSATRSSKSLCRRLLHLFECDFLDNTDIHSLVSTLSDDSNGKASILRIYYQACTWCEFDPKCAASGLFQAAREGKAQVYAVFGGQGANNPTCVKDLRELYAVYQGFLQDLIVLADESLRSLSQLEPCQHYFEGREFNLQEWIEEPSWIPDEECLSEAPFSFPLIGLLSLAHYCITCKVLGLSPGETSSMLRGVTGHSQGIIVAAAVSCCTSWESFHQVSASVIEVLFWIGYESHHHAPRAFLSPASEEDSVNIEEGKTSFLLSVRGLSRANIDSIVASFNMVMPEDQCVYLALANATDNFVVAGPKRSLRGLNLRLRTIKASDETDQSRIPHSKRKAIVVHRFLPVSAPFHTPYLEAAAEEIKARTAAIDIASDRFRIPIYNSENGLDIRSHASSGIIHTLIDAVVSQFVDWPAALHFPKDPSHILVFGGGRIGELVSKNKEGEAIRIIMGSDLVPSLNFGSKSEVFAPQMTSTASVPFSHFLPCLCKDTDGVTTLDTKLSRLLGTPPIMVAGMTPTTVPWDFVTAIMNAGYHTELAGGGYRNAEEMSAAIRNIVSTVAPGTGVTCNLIYVSPRAIAWQIPMLRRLAKQGVPIDGLTIGAGVPSPTIASEYIETLGLKHISFKPGSVEAIRNVIAIAKTHTSFPIILQWTGGRGGGHHSYEDFHTPILQTYADLRKYPNLILVAGSGFGDAADSYPYLTGEWSRKYGQPPMPYDGILLASRMMVAAEAHTSNQAKKLIVEASGTSDDANQWETTYDRSIGGVMTVQSEMGQPIHKIATRGVQFWAEMDRRIFSLPRAKRTAELAKSRDYIVGKLNTDYAKAFFGRKRSGEAVDLPAMTYGEVLERLISLMYIAAKKRWIDKSYQTLVFDFAVRCLERLPSDFVIEADMLKNPVDFLAEIFDACPAAHLRTIHPEDVSYFLHRCKAPGQKPVNFVPALDDDFEMWFKKDSLWQSEDIEAVIDEDAERVCILQGPVSAQYSKVANEGAKDILDNINKQYIDFVRRDFYSSRAPEKAIGSGAAPRRRKLLGFKDNNVDVSQYTTGYLLSIAPNSSVNPEIWFEDIRRNFSGWVRAVLSDEYVIQNRTRQANPMRSILLPKSSCVLQIDEEKCEITLIQRTGDLNTTLLEISSLDGRDIAAYLHHTKDTRTITLPLQFSFDPSARACGLVENMQARNTRIKTFYKELWNIQDLDGTESYQSEFMGEQMVISPKLFQDLNATLSCSQTMSNMTYPVTDVLPMDLCVVVAWKALITPLLIQYIEGDLLRLVHLSNTFQYCEGVSTLEVGDQIQTKSSIQAVKIQAEAGKSVVVRAEIERAGQVAVIVTSTFLFQGTFSDYDSTFEHILEPVTELRVNTLRDESLLLARDWLQLEDPIPSLTNSTLVFELSSRIVWKTKKLMRSLNTEGIVQRKTSQGHLQQIGVVRFSSVDCLGNPVMDYLQRKGVPTLKECQLKSPGWQAPTSQIVRMPHSNAMYERLSKDYNPIHVSQLFADYVDLPGTLTHGMHTSAVVRRIVEMTVAEGQPRRFRRFSASFTGMVLPGDKLSISVQHNAMMNGRMIFKVVAKKVDHGGTAPTVLEGEAEVEQPATAYIFTGQGSQMQGMGMALYDSSLPAKKLWDDTDRFLLDTYGWSVSEIVRLNPKTLTVQFGGRKGRRIRDNYLAMTIDSIMPDGRTVTRPILADLEADARSYTFTESRGLLFSTSFAQPAITLLEKATFEDMQANGLVQGNASFAGHSLGEYGVLSAMAEFMDFHSLMSVVFYRGLAMQSTMERDENGRTEFSMVAANPSRVGKYFTETALHRVVSMIAQESRALLEIVNLNVKEEQYVCAGHLENIHVLTQVLDHLSKDPSGQNLLTEITGVPASSPTMLGKIIRRHVNHAKQMPKPLELQRGIATIPLVGIDVPFHSSQLRSGVQPYRNFLRERISPSNVHAEKLVGKFHPNVMAKPFSLERSYVEEAASLTGSPVLQELLAIPVRS